MNRKFVSNSNIVLRKVLNSKDNLDIIKDLIESLVKIEIKEIKINPYLEEKSKYLPKEENFGIADVRVVLKNNEELNIGIQFIDGYYIKTKMLIYYSQIHNNQLEYNDKRNAVKTITINLLDFNYFDSSDYYTEILLETKQGNKDSKDHIQLHVFELPKFKINNQEFDRHEAWMTYLCGERNKQFNMVINKFEKIKKLDELLNDYWTNERME